MSQLQIPVVYVTDGCVIDLQQVATVICYKDAPTDQPRCRVILRSGVSFVVDMQYSRSLIQAVEWSRTPGSVVKPGDTLEDSGALVENSWAN